MWCTETSNQPTYLYSYLVLKLKMIWVLTFGKCLISEKATRKFCSKLLISVLRGTSNKVNKLRRLSGLLFSRPQNYYREAPMIIQPTVGPLGWHSIIWYLELMLSAQALKRHLVLWWAKVTSTCRKQCHFHPRAKNLLELAFNTTLPFVIGKRYQKTCTWLARTTIFNHKITGKRPKLPTQPIILNSLKIRKNGWRVIPI